MRSHLDELMDLAKSDIQPRYPDRGFPINGYPVGRAAITQKLKEDAEWKPKKQPTKKGFGNDLVSNETVNVRPYARKNLKTQTQFPVRQQRKVRLDTKSVPKDEETDE